VLEEVVGVLRSVEPRDNQLTIETGTGQVKLGFDRNTMVYTSTGLGTVRDLKPGVQLRAGRNAEMLAYWVQVRPAAPFGAPAPTPGQGTGPGGASGRSTEGGGGVTSPAPGGAVGPGSIGPSTTAPEGGSPGAAGATSGSGGATPSAGGATSGGDGATSGTGGTTGGAAGTAP
jgi:hypothetical protein